MAQAAAAPSGGPGELDITRRLGRSPSSGAVGTARWAFDELAGWAVVVGNLLAATGMLSYFFAGHRQLARRVSQALADEG